MSASPKLSVIIACYNYESFVERAIQSVVRERRDDCELVVVDDGSTDGSWDVIRRSGVTASRITNSGQRGACLFGLDKTTAPFVLFLDADDELKPGALGTIIERLDENVAKLQFPLTRIDADGNVLSHALPQLEAYRVQEPLIRQVIRTGTYVSPPTSGNVFRRDVCQLLRESDYDKSVDGAMLFAAPFFGDIVSISEEIGSYRVHGNNDSGLGRTPEASVFQRDIDRFLARMEHLRSIIQRFEPDEHLVDPHDTFYFHELKFCRDVASGHQPGLASLLKLLSRLMTDTISVKKKIVLAVFYTLASAVSNDRGKSLIAYRFKTGTRTFAGFTELLAARRTLT
jgi:glycosyltransferase involved in cell wall biosynthesis